jgi:hypothetical protein
MQLLVLDTSRPAACSFHHVIPEIDIWRAAKLMLKRYGDKVLQETADRADELVAGGDHNGAATWRQINNALDISWTNATWAGALTSAGTPISSLPQGHRACRETRRLAPADSWSSYRLIFAGA